jgi:DNA-binding NarL/FixJ family response regulator
MGARLGSRGDNAMERAAVTLMENKNASNIEYYKINTRQSVIGPGSSIGQDDLGRVAVIGKQVLITECLARCISSEFGCAVSIFDDFNTYQQNHADPAFSVVILIDESARSCSVSEALQNFADSRTPVIVVSRGDDPDLVSELLRNGARGCIPSTTTIQVALQAIRLVLVGGVFVPANSQQTPGGRPGLPPMLQDTDGAALTRRQADVARAIKQGKANKLIAHELQMSENTVKVHVHNILKKLQVTNRTEAALKMSATEAM